MEILIKYLINAIFAAIPAVGFGMVFNVPRDTLLKCAYGGAIAYCSREFFMDLNFSLELATFFASTLVGVIALYWSRKYIVPRPVYTIASIIPLLPGKQAFGAIINLITMNAHGVTPDLITLFIDNSLKTIIVLGGIGFGLALPSLYYIRYNRPII
ncbi:threonine/serine exporter family protein [Campylobacterota bacterium DY0563]|uniref:threonine/serine exporter family protein n=1 Tax=Halarcobacter sp. TaxID=2321133 RepID=UPI002AA620D0|nr:threonine/serine exporter family protein [Halarcobacter sp.]